jgi:hypothetical protein
MCQIVVIFTIFFRYGKVDEREKDAKMCEREKGEMFIVRD